MSRTLEDAVVVVTGGGAGVGQALAVEAARRGARVAIASPREATATIGMVEAVGGEAIWVRTDISDYGTVTAAADRIADALGGVDVLVNNAAGSSAPGRLQGTDPGTVRRQFEINVLGTYHCLRAFYAPLAESATRGRLAHVLNVGSEHSLGVPPHVPPLSTYTVTKYTSLAFTDVVERDFAAAGIGVTLVAPGWVLTDTVVAAAEQVPAIAASVEGRGQAPDLVARMSWDAVEEGRYLVLTNPASRAFAVEHARRLLAALEPVDAGLAADHQNGGE
jgi:NAD(P)-dependent dehydrogenase (short-subunit alcohol dehydrogenase family)